MYGKKNGKRLKSLETSEILNFLQTDWNPTSNLVI